MAERRMFAKTIIDSDAFLEMPATTQVLYFHLSMRADDDGFINNPKSIMRTTGCKDDDLKLLMAKKFIIPFESGVCVIKHWKIHNYIQRDRYNETKYKNEKALLQLDENKAYTLEKTAEYVSCVQDGYNMDTQVRLGKVSIGKDNNICANDINDLFEKLWKLYPIKRGKGSISKTQKEKLFKIGHAEMERAINRYIAEQKDKGTDIKFYKNGSTFFNSGYIDYLDENYTDVKVEERGRSYEELWGG